MKGKWLLALILALLVTVLASSALAEDILIDEYTFQDDSFRDYVATYCDTNSDGRLSTEEIAAVTEIEVQEKDINSMKGIEVFTALKKLNCAENYDLKTLDLSSNTALEVLIIYYTDVTVLDLSANIALKELECYTNNLETLNVRNCHELTNLLCFENNLSELDVTGCPALLELSFADNNLMSVDVSQNTELVGLYAGMNQLNTLDVSHNTKLKELFCYVNELTELDLSHNSVLQTLSCHHNLLTRLDLSNCPGLIRLMNSDYLDENGYYEDPETYNCLEFDPHVRIIAGGEDDYTVLALPADLIEIAEEAFAGTSFEMIEIPAGCSRIGSNAFANCANLKQVHILNPGINVDGSAFAHCSPTLLLPADASALQAWAEANNLKWVYE